MVVDESINHHGSRFRLIHRNHVTSSVNLDEAHENGRVGASDGTNPTDSFAVVSPFIIRSSVEVSLTSPAYTKGNGFVAHPVADVVVVTSVVEVTNTSFNQLGNQSIEATEFVFLGKHAVDGEVAGLPSDGRFGTQRSLDISAVEEGSHLVELITERRNLTFLSDVIGIEASVHVGGEKRIASFSAKGTGFIVAFIAFLAGLGASRDGEVHQFGGELGDARLVIGTISFATSCCHCRVEGILNFGVDQAVTGGEASEVDLDFVGAIEVGVVDGRGGGGRVVSTVGFTDDEEFVIFHFRISSKKMLEESVVVMTNLFFVMIGATGVGVGEANTGRLINPDDVGLIVPAIGVLVEFPGGFVDVAGAVLSKKRRP